MGPREGNCKTKARLVSARMAWYPRFGGATFSHANEVPPVKDHLLAKSTWIRGFFMLVYAFLYAVARFVTLAVVLFQFGALLLTGRVNERLLDFGQSLSMYTYQMMRYLTYNTEVKPFPLSPWPAGTQTPETLGGKD